MGKRMENNAKENTTNIREFTYVKEKVRSRKRNKIKKIVLGIALTCVCAAIFGVVARATFILSGSYLEKVLGVEATKSLEEPEQVTDNVQRHPVSLEPGSEKTGTDRNSTQTAQSSTDTGEVKANDKTSDNDAVNTKTVSQGLPERSSDKNTPPAATGTPDDAENEDPINGQNENGQQSDPEKAASKEAVSTQTGDNTGEPSSQPAGSEQSQIQDSGITVSSQETINPYGENYVNMMMAIKQLAATAGKGLVTVKSVVRTTNWLGEEFDTVDSHYGVLMAEDGVDVLIVTPYQGLSDANRIDVVFNNQEIYPASLYTYDPDYNIAVVGVNLDIISQDCFRNISYLNIGGEQGIEVGDPLIAIGKANGYPDSVSVGIVTSMGHKVYLTDGCVGTYTTDMQYSSQSEGVLIDFNGNLVGAITHNFEDSSSSPMFTAVNIDSILAVTIRLLNGQKSNYVGLRCSDIPSDVMRGLGLENGIYIDDVATLSPAATAGLKRGDIITSVNGALVGSVAEYNTILMQLERGDRMDLKVIRNSDPEESVREIQLKVSTK